MVIWLWMIVWLTSKSTRLPFADHGAAAPAARALQRQEAALR